MSVCLCLGVGYSAPASIRRRVLALVVISWFVSTAFAAGTDVAIDTGQVSSFGAAEDAAGNLWVAIGWPDDKLQVFRSTDRGESWMSVLWFPLDGRARKIEVIASPLAAIDTADARVFVFFLTTAGAGDLWVCSIRMDSGLWQNLAVAVGPDTIDDFSVTVDRDSDYYLYCLYVNEHRSGLNGRFIRSTDKGRTWEAGQEWWNAADPCISAGRGSVIHAVWRYVGNGREIHYCANRAFGRPAYWSSFQRIKSGGPKCWEPVVVEADTGERGVWVLYTVGRRDTVLTDLEYIYSSDGGYTWNKTMVLGEPFLGEWAPALRADRFSGSGFVDLVYNVGGMLETDPVVVVWRCASTADPGFWSAPVIMSDYPADRGLDGCRPRIGHIQVTNPRGPLVFFSRSTPSGANGVYCDAPWRPFPIGLSGRRIQQLRCTPNPSTGLTTVEASGTVTVRICDLAGRVIRTLHLDSRVGAAVWDGRDAQGRLVSEGTYAVLAQGADGRFDSAKTLLRICRREGR